MLRPLKLTCPPEDLFFLSDAHWHHDKPFILQPRGFATIEDHDSTLIRRWNETCTDTSTVFHLGDLMARADEALFWALVRRLRFKRLYLLWGNHLSGQKQAYLAALRAQFPNAFDETGQSAAHYEVYPLNVNVDGDPGRMVTFLPEYVEVNAGKTPLVLCHYPILSHHGIGHEAIHLCGHSHSGLPLTNKDTGKGLRLDVGVESFGRPVSLAEIKRHLAGRDLDIRDHHIPGGAPRT
jgi:calcineurin-like phosphoesterase family protein